MKYTGRFKELFDDREIDLDLAAVRHHVYLDLEDVFEADPNYRDLEPGQLRDLKRKVAQTPGIVMVRHAPPLKGRTDEPIFAELRPLDAVRHRIRPISETRTGEFSQVVPPAGIEPARPV